MKKYVFSIFHGIHFSLRVGVTLVRVSIPFIFVSLIVLLLFLLFKLHFASHRLRKLNSFLVVLFPLRLVIVLLLHLFFRSRRIRFKPSRVLLLLLPKRTISMDPLLSLTLFPELVFRWRFLSGLPSFVRLPSWK